MQRIRAQDGKGIEFIVENESSSTTDFSPKQALLSLLQHLYAKYNFGQSSEAPELTFQGVPELAKGETYTPKLNWKHESRFTLSIEYLHGPGEPETAAAYGLKRHMFRVTWQGEAGIVAKEIDYFMAQNRNGLGR